MKRLLTLLYAIIVVIGIKADITTVTIADFNHLPTTYGALSNENKCFTTNAASGVAGLTLTTASPTLNSGYVNGNYGNCLGIVTPDTEAHTITLTAPSGYIITGYSIGASSNSHSYQHVLTAANGTTTGDIDSYGYIGRFVYLTINGLLANQTTFTIQTKNGGNTLYIPYFTVTLRPSSDFASSITSGKYYRLISMYDKSCSMTEEDGKLYVKTIADGLHNQIWKITKSAGKYTLQGALSEKYIQEAYQSTQVLTAAASHSFTLRSKTQDGLTLFTFDESTDANKALHCSTDYQVVGWIYSESKSWWVLEELDIDEEELTAMRNALSTDYTTQLSTFFDDAACTTLKSTYSGMTDDELRTAMSALPTALQNMAVCVKNNTWTTDKGKSDYENLQWNVYEKDFRIHDYDIFSNSTLWHSITGTGPFSHLFHPTGIQARAGQVIYLYVGSDVADSDATLSAECVTGVDCTGTAYTLKQGYNAIYVSKDCEIFISYLLNNTSKSCNSYPDITVHIEGGTCNGCFDMRGHGHTNTDWEYLKSNMFSGTYLHVKGNSTLLNCYRERVVDPSNEQNVEGIMNIFDFVFDELQKLTGCTQWSADGRYKMMTNNYDVTSGNPHWAYNYGYAQPGIWYNGIFNYGNLSNVGTDGGHIWVISHELGHGHQKPINLSGQTESSNNSLAQCVNFLTTNSSRGKELFTTTRSSRGDGVKGMISRFNNGYSWIDYGGFRTQTGGYDDTWISNKLIFQLWLYFDYMGNYQPYGGNTGYSFISELYNRVRETPLVKSSSSASPRPATDDWLRIAQEAADITETDLSEYFEAWGFWKLEPCVSNSNDIPASNTWYFSDYTSTYVQTSAEQVSSVKATMEGYSKKGGNIMFLEDRCTGSTLATYNNATVDSYGETGYYGSYSKKISAPYSVSVEGTTVTISDGAGAVGFKIYDDEHNLVYIANTTSFTVSDAIATGLSNGTYKLVAAQGDCSDLEVGQFTFTLNNAKSLDGATHSYGTAYYPFGIELPDGVNAYYLKDDKRTKNETTFIIPTLIGQQIPASTPVLLVGDEDAGSIVASKAEVAGSNPGDNTLQGTTTSEVSDGESHLVLNKNSEGYIGFYNLRSGKSVAANRAYIPYNNISVKGLTIMWDETDGIEEIQGAGFKIQDSNIFDLSGRSISVPSASSERSVLPKGIYIVNGKKIVVK